MKLTLAAIALAALLTTSASAQVPQTSLRGSASTTGTGATTIIAAQGAGVSIFITGIQCSNSGGTTGIVTFNDSASSVLLIPTLSGFYAVFTTPLVVAANTDFTFTSSVSSTTVYCNAQGYKWA